VNRVFDGQQVHVRRLMCDTCIFRPGNLMNLEPGRVEEMVAGAADNGCIPCHEHLGSDTEPVCAGYFKRHQNQILQIAERLKVIQWH
jgi:hypothetical protein